MLQQTQAARVVPRFEAFLARFPDVHALAAAPPRDVLHEWSGLGYNRRALALRAAARHVAEHGWPADLTALPGVGAYTAAAVSSFAWGAHAAPARRAGARAAPTRPGRHLEPGDDGARRDGLHRPRRPLRRLPGGARLRERGRPAGAAARPREAAPLRGDRPVRPRPRGRR